MGPGRLLTGSSDEFDAKTCTFGRLVSFFDVSSLTGSQVIDDRICGVFDVRPWRLTALRYAGDDGNYSASVILHLLDDFFVTWFDGHLS